MTYIKAILFKKQRMFLLAAALFTASLVLNALVLAIWDQWSLAPIPDQPSAAPTGQLSIVIKIPSRVLELYSDGAVYKKYRIAVGKRDTPTPIGNWIITWKSYRAGDVFGTRFFGLDVPWGGYGIHGTNAPWDIGGFVSHGCVRLRNKDIEELYEWVPVGTPVRIEDRPETILRALKYEHSGTDVVQLQVKLQSLGYYEGRADGFYNRDTEIAVKRLQHDKGVKQTGVVDKTLLNFLGL